MDPWEAVDQLVVALLAAAQWEITNGNVTVNYCIEANMNAAAIFAAMRTAHLAQGSGE